MKKGVIFAFILGAILISNSYAIGLKADKFNHNVNFEPNFRGTYYYGVVTTLDVPVDLIFYVKDKDDDGTITNLSKYFVLSDTLMKNVLPKNEPYFSVSLNLPSKIEEPGTHIVRVGVREKLPGDASIGIATAMESLFFIHVPYEGQYLRYSLDAEDINTKENMPVTISLTNFGTEDMKKVYVDIKLLDGNNITVSAIKSETFSLKIWETKKIELQMSTSALPPGTYVAEGTAYYDDKNKIATDSVKIGQLNFKIINQTETIYADKINEINLDVESEWADSVKGVYADITIANRESVRTLTESFSGFEIKKLKSFFDAKGLQPGTYDMNMNLKFEGKTTSKNAKINVIKENLLRMPNIEFTLTNMLLMAIVIIILIINITLFIILIKKKKESDEKRE